MTPEQFQARVAEVMAEEAEQPESLWYLSFADDANGGFLGAAIVMAHGIATAVKRCNELGINPGGEVRAIRVPEVLAGQWPLDTLLSKVELGETEPWE